MLLRKKCAGKRSSSNTTIDRCVQYERDCAFWDCWKYKQLNVHRRREHS